MTLLAWKIGGLVLDGATALTVLARLPGRQAPPLPGVVLGDSLYFWAQAARLALEMIAGQRASCPPPRPGAGEIEAYWEPVFTDSRDLARRTQLIQAMPPVARAVLPPGRSEQPLAPAVLLDGFLRQTIGDAVRTWALGAPLPATTQGTRLSHEWVLGLLTLDTVAQSTPAAIERFRDQYHAWRDPLQAAVGEAAFRICFRLEPPGAEDKPAPKPWTLRYFLQATDDLSLLVPVTTVWRSGGTTLHYLNRRFDRPQERLLAGLGQAGRLFPPIAASLHTAAPSTAALDVTEAYTFLREAGPLLETGGFGVLVPPWWTRRGARPGLKVTLAPGKANDKTASGLLGMDSLVAFDWAVALGEETITPEEFVRLAQLKTPLVQVKGQWVELRPGDADAAIRFWGDAGQGRAVAAARRAAPGPGYRRGCAPHRHQRGRRARYRPAGDAGDDHRLAARPVGATSGHRAPARSPLPARLAGYLAALSTARRLLAGLPAPLGSRRMPGRRYGPGQDGATAGPAAARQSGGWGLGVGGW